MRITLVLMVLLGLVLSVAATGLAAPVHQTEATPTAFVPPTVQQPPTATPRPTATPPPQATATPRARVQLPTTASVRDAALRGALIAVAAYGVGFLYLLSRAGLRALLRLRTRRMHRRRASALPPREDGL